MWNGKGRLGRGVALLIDFENLMRGVERGGGAVDCGALTALAAGYGRVRVASAYADWRMADTGRYRERVSRAGIEPVDVLARRRGAVVKNAVDVRMAVDAVDLVWSVPGVDVFVLGTGDGDFVHVVRTLKRRGKTVVGVCPRGAASDGLAAACHEFVNYGRLADRVVAGRRTVAGSARGAAGWGRWRRTAKRALRRFGDGRGFAGVRCGAVAAPVRNADPSAKAAPGVGLPERPLGGGGEPRPGVRSVDSRHDADRAAGRGRGTGPAGLAWVRWARARLASGGVAANADGGWLHRIGDEAYVVVPDCFEEYAVVDGLRARTVKNRVVRLGLHRVRRTPDGVADLFRAALGDGRMARGMLFPGRLLWGDDEPEFGSATLRVARSKSARTAMACGTGRRSTFGRRQRDASKHRA